MRDKSTNAKLAAELREAAAMEACDNRMGISVAGELMMEAADRLNPPPRKVKVWPVMDEQGGILFYLSGFEAEHIAKTYSGVLCQPVEIELKPMEGEE